MASIELDAAKLADYIEWLAANDKEAHWSLICSKFGWSRWYFNRVKHEMVNRKLLIDRKVAFEVYPARGVYSGGAARYGTDPLIARSTLDWNLGYLETRTKTGLYLLEGYGQAYPAKKRVANRTKTYWEAALLATEDARTTL